jgi:hypothetical protein
LRRGIGVKDGEVPQDRARTLDGQRKALYAVNEQGEYHIVKSAGWEAEEIVLNQAIVECDEQTADAWDRARRGLTSPLEYHMRRRRMDVLVLAQSTGFFQWQVRRHLRPETFRRLSARQFARYADALGLTREQLVTLPPAP